MNSSSDQTTTRLASTSAIAGSVLMLAGAGFWASSGTDLWLALDNDDVAAYLEAVATAKTLLVTNLSLWMAGVLVLGVAGEALSRLPVGRPTPGLAAAVCIRTAIPLALVAFILMLALVVRVAPGTSPGDVRLAEAIGWAAARADDLATALIVGFGPLFFSMGAAGDWAPRWLVRWGYLAGAVGTFSLAVPYVAALSGLSTVIVPVGIGWMLAAGFVLRRRG